MGVRVGEGERGDRKERGKELRTKFLVSSNFNMNVNVF